MVSVLGEHFADLPDPRRAQGRRHSLSDRIVLAVTAVIRGADSWADVYTFGVAKLKEFKTFLDLPHDIPSADTFERVFARLAEAVGGHWGIENKLRDVLDVGFAEDPGRIRKGHAAQNFSRIRRIALNLLRRETAKKRGIKGKRLLAAWDHDDILKTVDRVECGCP